MTTNYTELLAEWKEFHKVHHNWLEINCRSECSHQEDECEDCSDWCNFGKLIAFAEAVLEIPERKVLTNPSGWEIGGASHYNEFHVEVHELGKGLVG